MNRWSTRGTTKMPLREVKRGNPFLRCCCDSDMRVSMMRGSILEAEDGTYQRRGKHRIGKRTGLEEPLGMPISLRL